MARGGRAVRAEGRRGGARAPGRRAGGAGQGAAPPARRGQPAPARPRRPTTRCRSSSGSCPPAGSIPSAARPGSSTASAVYATPGWRDSPWTQAVEFSTSDGPGRIEVAYTRPRPTRPFLEEERAAPGFAVGDAGEPPRAAQAPAGAGGPGRGSGRPSCARRTRSSRRAWSGFKELERLRDDLVNMVVHDMRSPLMALMMRLDLIGRRTPGLAAKGLDDAMRSAATLNRMADTLLDVSRLESGKMPLRLERWDLASLARDTREALSSMDAERVIEVVADGPVMVTCDKALVRRVLENLVSNGIKHTPSGGRLRIEVKALPGRARVTVQDEGPGVPPEARERIFEKFGTVEARKDQAYHSAGLGLAFCKLAMEAHGGRHRRGGRQPAGEPLLDRASGDAGGAPGASRSRGSAPDRIRLDWVPATGSPTTARPPGRRRPRDLQGDHPPAVGRRATMVGTAVDTRDAARRGRADPARRRAPRLQPSRRPERPRRLPAHQGHDAGRPRGGLHRERRRRPPAPGPGGGRDGLRLEAAGVDRPAAHHPVRPRPHAPARQGRRPAERALQTGARARTAVPPPTFDSITTSPPTSFSRSCMRDQAQPVIA